MAGPDQLWGRPDGVAVDAADNLYVTCLRSGDVRRIDPKGTVTTVAELFLPRGVAVDAAGNVYVADFEGHRLHRLDSAGGITTLAGTGQQGSGGDGGPATVADLLFPTGVAVDAWGNIYIAQDGNDHIRRVDRDGVITTVARLADPGIDADGIPATTARLHVPRAIAVDTDGTVYIADFYSEWHVAPIRLRRVDTTGIITTVLVTDRPRMPRRLKAGP